MEPPRTRKRCPETNRKAGVFEQIHLKINKKEFAILRSAKIGRILPMGTLQQKAFEDLKQYLI
jgi:hypothetical protein